MSLSLFEIGYLECVIQYLWLCHTIDLKQSYGIFSPLGRVVKKQNEIFLYLIKSRSIMFCYFILFDYQQKQIEQFVFNNFTYISQIKKLIEISTNHTALPLLFHSFGNHINLFLSCHKFITHTYITSFFNSYTTYGLHNCMRKKFCSNFVWHFIF